MAASTGTRLFRPKMTTHTHNKDILAEIIGFCDLCDLAKLSCVSTEWYGGFVWSNCRIVRVDAALCARLTPGPPTRWSWFLHKLLAAQASIEIFEWHAPQERGHRIVSSPLGKSWLEYIAPSLRRCSIWWDSDEDMKVIKSKLIPNLNPSLIRSLQIDGCSRALIPAFLAKSRDGGFIPIRWNALTALTTSVSMPKNVFAFLYSLSKATNSLSRLHIGFPALDPNMHPDARNEFCNLINRVVSANAKTLNRFSVAGRQAEEWIQSFIFHGAEYEDSQTIPESRFLSAVADNCMRYVGLPLRKLAFSESLCVAYLKRSKPSLPTLMALFDACHPDPLEPQYCSNLRAVLDRAPEELLRLARFTEWILHLLESGHRDFNLISGQDGSGRQSGGDNIDHLAFITGSLFARCANTDSSEYSRLLPRLKILLAQVECPLDAIVSCLAVFPAASVQEWAKPVEMLLRDHAWWSVYGRDVNRAVSYNHPIMVYLTSSAFACVDALVRHPDFDTSTLNEVIGEDGETVLGRWLSRYSDMPALAGTTRFVLKRFRLDVQSRLIPALRVSYNLLKRPLMLLLPDLADCFESPRGRSASAQICV